MAFYGIEPFGTERDNMHAAIIAQVIAAVHGNKTKASDFMLRVKEKIKEQTPAQMMAVLKMFTNWFNGKKQT